MDEWPQSAPASWQAGGVRDTKDKIHQAFGKFSRWSVLDFDFDRVREQKRQDQIFTFDVRSRID